MRKWFKIFFPLILILILLFLIIRGSTSGGGQGQKLYLQCITLLIFSMTLATLSTPLMRKLALKLRILDRPDARKVHSVPMPLLGGFAVAFSFFLVILINFHFSYEMKGVILGSLLMLGIGIVDDIKPLSASLKLLVQLIACLILASFGVMVSFLPNTVPGKIGEFFITFILIIWIINAVNFFDGLDGLASGLVAISSTFFLIVGLQTHQIYFSYLAACLIGCCLGFLIHNFYPANIFLGDAGSNFLGFSLGALAVMGGWSERGPAIAFSTPLLILSIFIFDMIYITVSRIITGKTRNIKEILEYTGKDHLHHRFINIGFTHRQSVGLIYLLSILVSLGAIVLRTTLSPLNVSLLLVQAFLIFLILSLLMRERK